MIITERLLLRPFVESDLDEVFKGLSHPDIIKYYGISFDSREAAKEQMIWYRELEENRTGIWWAVCSSDNLNFMGAAGLNNLNKEHQKAELGFWLMPEHWGKGVISEALPFVFNYGFEKLGLHRIEAIVETENLNSKRVMESLSFHHEGTLKECEFKDGRFISLDLYAKLNTATDG